jgi:hypothetical protein
MSDGPATAGGDLDHDRVALRALVDRYAVSADAKRYGAMAGCFTDDGVFEMCMTPGDPEPTAVRRGAAEIEAAMTSLDPFEATSHLIGAQAVEVDGDRATGETTCVAHHVLARPNGRRLLTMGIRYDDRFRRTAGGWRLEHRRLNVLWQERRPIEG